MRSGFLAGMLSALLFAGAIHAEEVPKLVTSGLDTYKTTGSGEAFANECRQGLPNSSRHIL